VSSENKGSSGMGFVSGLQLLFIGLKLGKVIDWSWWLVLSPFLGVIAGLILFFAGCFFYAMKEFKRIRGK
jgi:hypothetical protein